jgi:hypothetical protein
MTATEAAVDSECKLLFFCENGTGYEITLDELMPIVHTLATK